MLFDTIVRQAQQVTILDQTALPLIWRSLTLTTVEDMAHAIRSMQVRGAPLIGASAAYGIALAMQSDASDTSLQSALATLAATRPTAVNLNWALARMQRVLTPLADDTRRQTAWAEADRIRTEDIAANHAIGQHGLSTLKTLATELQVSPARPLQCMTHCNAGALATCGWGTALAPVYAACQSNLPVHVWVSETRPRNQGYLTAAELAVNHVSHTLIADNAAGLLMQQGRADIVITGADRIAVNGDTANKVGTYLKALAAHAAGIPFYIAAPTSTIDIACPDGMAIPIEERNGEELRLACGSAPDGRLLYTRCIALEEPVCNPAFDITPASLISGIITEKGVFAPHALAKLLR